jgi:hypothetical protein
VIDGTSRPLRIAVLIGSLDIGGAERQLIRLVNNLDRSRVRADNHPLGRVPAALTMVGA